jgi:hypothetical protein
LRKDKPVPAGNVECQIDEVDLTEIDPENLEIEVQEKPFFDKLVNENGIETLFEVMKVANYLNNVDFVEDSTNYVAKTCAEKDPGDLIRWLNQ